jgi:hypothetical protein
MAADIISAEPDSPRLFTMAADDAAVGTAAATAAAVMSTLLVPAGRRSPCHREYVSAAMTLTLFVERDEMLVRIRLVAYGGTTARFAIGAGSAWEALCRALLGMANLLPATPAQLVFWWRRMAGGYGDDESDGYSGEDGGGGGWDCH